MATLCQSYVQDRNRQRQARSGSTPAAPSAPAGRVLSVGGTEEANRRDRSRHRRRGCHARDCDDSCDHGHDIDANEGCHGLATPCVEEFVGASRGPILASSSGLVVCTDAPYPRTLRVPFKQTWSVRVGTVASQYPQTSIRNVEPVLPHLQPKKTAVVGQLFNITRLATQDIMLQVDPVLVFADSNA